MPSARTDQAATLPRVDRPPARAPRARPRGRRVASALDAALASADSVEGSRSVGRAAARACVTLLSVLRTLPCVVPAMSPIVRDAAETTPRTPAVAAVKASAPMSATPEIVRTSTSRAMRSAPTATISRPFTAPTMTRGTTLVLKPRTLIALRRALPRPLPSRLERAPVRVLPMAMPISLLRPSVITMQSPRNEYVTKYRHGFSSEVLRFVAGPARQRLASA
jgi:hypothetical protein